MWLRSMISSSLRTCTAGHVELNDKWYVRPCGISCFQRTQSKTTSSRMQRKEVEKTAFNLHFCFTTNQQPETGLSSKLQPFCTLTNKACVHASSRFGSMPHSVEGAAGKGRNRNWAHAANLAAYGTLRNETKWYFAKRRNEENRVKGKCDQNHISPTIVSLVKGLYPGVLATSDSQLNEQINKPGL